MERLTEIKPIYCEHIPQKLEHGFVYISEEFHCSIHLCACGCGEKTVLPFNIPGEWTLTKHLNGTVSFKPSIGNFSVENPYHAHYFITENKIDWCK